MVPAGHPGLFWVAMEDDLGPKLIQQAFDLWINPEIERRRAAGRLPDGFTLYMAQVIFDLDAAAPEVRLNEEVRIALKVPATRPLEKGEIVVVDHIEGMELTDLDPNASHLTMVFNKGVRYLAWDFRYNAVRIVESIETAREFLDCSAFALEKGYLRAVVDNLFSATELMAKAQLLMLPDKTILTGKKHRIVSSKYNWWGKLGNTDPRYVCLLNRLSALRNPARYLRKNLVLTVDEARSMLAVAEEMFTTLCASAPKRIRVTDTS